jgi:hypothetical protein
MANGYHDWADTPMCPECRRDLDWEFRAIEGHIAIAFVCRIHGEIQMRDTLRERLLRRYQAVPQWRHRTGW